MTGATAGCPSLLYLHLAISVQVRVGNRLPLAIGPCGIRMAELALISVVRRPYVRVPTAVPGVASVRAVPRRVVVARSARRDSLGIPTGRRSTWASVIREVLHVIQGDVRVRPLWNAVAGHVQAGLRHGVEGGKRRGTGSSRTA